MGISQMQGTPAHLEYIKNDKIKKGNCKSCINYFDGICKVRDLVIEYGANGSRLCKEFQLEKSFEYDDIRSSRRKEIKKKSKGKSENKNSTSITSQTHHINLKKQHKTAEVIDNYNGAITLGNEIEIMDTKETDQIFKIEITKGKATEEIINRVLGKRLGYRFTLRDREYIITEILK